MTAHRSAALTVQWVAEGSLRQLCVLTVTLVQVELTGWTPQAERMNSQLTSQLSIVPVDQTYIFVTTYTSAALE